MAWIKLLTREGDFLKNYLLYENLVKNFLETYGYSHPDFMTIRNDSLFTHYIDDKSQHVFTESFIKKAARNKSYASLMTLDAERKFKKLTDFCTMVNDLELSNYPTSELSNYLKEYFRLYKVPYPYFNVTVIIGDIEGYNDLANALAELRMKGRESFNHAHALIEPLFEKIAERFSCTVADVKFLTPSEILALLSGEKIDISGAKKKRMFCRFRLLQGRFTIDENYSGDEKEMQNYSEKSGNSESSAVVKGKGTFPSKAKGKVRIVRSKKDISLVAKGDVIVLAMTTPDMIGPALKKVAAIITDEGGLTCHAAVISRELRIPAIIGTGNATKILKDGDIVEVDTNKGIARIVQR